MTKENLITIGVVIFISLVFIFSGSFIRVIPAGHVGVVFNLFGGVEKRVLREGINILVPIIESATVYDGRKVAYHFTDTFDRRTVGQSIKCQTNDGQNVSIDVSVIVPQTRSIFRNIVAKYPIDTVYTTGRTGLSLDAKTSLRNAFKKNWVILDDLLIRGIEFSQTFAEAVERKQIALQESQRQNWIKKTAEREKERKIIEGEGDARALSVRGQAILLDPRIAELEFLEQLEQNGNDFTVITGTKNAILSIGDFLTSMSSVGIVKKE